jgi:hypothetical protein
MINIPAPEEVSATRTRQNTARGWRVKITGYSPPHARHSARVRVDYRWTTVTTMVWADSHEALWRLASERATEILERGLGIGEKRRSLV